MSFFNNNWLQRDNNLSDIPSPSTALANLGLSGLGTINSWSEFDYDANRDGQAGSNGWTETGATHGTATKNGITHHRIYNTSGVNCYINRSLSITSATEWEAQVEFEVISQTYQNSIAIFDGTRRIWIYATTVGVTNYDGALAYTGDVNSASEFPHITIRKVGGASGVVEAWVGPQYLGRKLYTAFFADATGAHMRVGKSTATGNADAHIRRAKFNKIGTWNSPPSVLFRNTVWGR